MAKCVMCEKEVNGFYDYEGAKIPICFEHYEDGTFANYLAAQPLRAVDEGVAGEIESDGE